MIGAPTVQNNSSRSADGLLWLLALTLLVRVGVLFAVPGSLAGDPDGYRRLAENLVEHGTLGEGTQPTAYRPPLYPLLLAPCVAMGDRAATAAIGALHVLLGLGTVWLVWRIGQKCGLGRWAVLAGALVACDPILLGQSTVVMTETAAAFLVALALLALVRACATACRTERSETASPHTACGFPFIPRRLASSAESRVASPSALSQAVAHARWVVAGASLGLCGLCRPELLLWAATCAAAMFVLPKPNRDREGADIARPSRSPKPSRDREGAVSPPSTEGEKSTMVASDRSLTVAARFDSTVAALFSSVVAARLPVCMAMVAGAAAVLLPWVVRNQIQFGRPIVATTHGGYTLLLANNPSFYRFLRDSKPGTVWDARELGPVWGGRAHHDSPAAELAADRQAYALAWQNIRRDPAMFAWSCAVRAGRFWSLAPHQGSMSARWAIGAWYLAEFILAAVGVLFYHRGTEDTETNDELTKTTPPCPPCLRGEFPRVWLWGVLLALSMTAVHAVFWSDMRMRGPLVPVVALAAAGGIAWLWGCVRASQAHAA